MRYSTIKRSVLSHIDQYSVAGTPVAKTYNNQEDYLLRIPELINEALVTIRTTVKPAPQVHTLWGGQEHGDMMRFFLPENFWTLRSGGVSVVRDGEFRKTNNYRLQGKYILVPKNSGTYTIEYYKYPERLPPVEDLTDDFDLDEDIEVIQAATYYAAANLVLREDEFMYTALFNDFESRLMRLSNGITTEVHPVEDAYSFGAAGWCE